MLVALLFAQTLMTRDILAHAKLKSLVTRACYFLNFVKSVANTTVVVDSRFLLPRKVLIKRCSGFIFIK